MSNEVLPPGTPGTKYSIQFHVSPEPDNTLTITGFPNRSVLQDFLGAMEGAGIITDISTLTQN